MSQSLINAFLKDLSILNDGLICWGFAAGSGTGSMVTLHFGEKIVRESPLKNKYLSEDMRNYEGEQCLYLEDCDWRIQTSTSVLASSLSSNEEGGEMLVALNQLVGKRVTAAQLELPSFDLRLEFENDLRLVVFCFGKSLEDLDNYTFYSKEHSYTSKFNGKLESSEAKQI